MKKLDDSSLGISERCYRRDRRHLKSKQWEKFFKELWASCSPENVNVEALRKLHSKKK